jgi:hypothetical protein
MRLHGISLVGLVVLALVSLLFLSACIFVPVDEGRRRGDRDWHGDRNWHGDGRDRDDDHRR